MFPTVQDILHWEYKLLIFFYGKPHTVPSGCWVLLQEKLFDNKVMQELAPAVVLARQTALVGRNDRKGRTIHKLLILVRKVWAVGGYDEVRQQWQRALVVKSQ